MYFPSRFSFRFLPCFYKEHVTVSLAKDAKGSDGAKAKVCVRIFVSLQCAGVVRQAIGRRLEMAQWREAFTAFAIAMALTNVLGFQSAMKHLFVCLAVSAAAHAEGRRELLGSLYDECARCVVLLASRHWFVAPVRAVQGGMGGRATTTKEKDRKREGET